MSWEELLLDRIYYDDTIGVPGTAWPIGTPQVPSDVIADVITMCVARNLHQIQVHGALTLGDAMEHYCFIGHDHGDVADVLALAGQDVDSSVVHGMVVSGIQGGTGILTLVRCIITGLTVFNGRMENCELSGGAFSLKDIGNTDLNNCKSLLGQVTITVQAPTLASIKQFAGDLILTLQDGGLCNIEGFKGLLEIDEMTAGTLNIFATGADIQINADCTGGTINIYGSGSRVTGAGGGVVINDYRQDAVTAAGRIQVAETTIDLNQGIASYPLLTGTTQDVIVEKLVITMPNIVAGGALTAISIETDNVTAQVFIDAVLGAVANLTAEAQLAYVGAISVKAGSVIQLTIAGGAHGLAYVCDVEVQYRSVVAGGYLV